MKPHLIFPGVASSGEKCVTDWAFRVMCVFFRTTSDLENFQNHILMYAGKLFAYFTLLGTDSTSTRSPSTGRRAKATITFQTCRRPSLLRGWEVEWAFPEYRV